VAWRGRGESQPPSADHPAATGRPTQQQLPAAAAVGNKQQQRSSAAAAYSTPHRPLSPRAAHALELYRECGAAGQRCKIMLEQRRGGEYITLQISPPAARAAGRSRPPNLRRAEQQAAKKGARQQQRKQQQPGHTSSGDNQPSVPTAPATPTRSYAAVVVTPQQQEGAGVPTPRLTRARKKRKAEGSPATASPPQSNLPQLDGAHSPPPTPSSPTTPPQLPTPSPSRSPPTQTPPPPSPSPAPRLSAPLPPPPTTPPEPPPPPPSRVLCRFCKTVEHSDIYFICAVCHWNYHAIAYRDCPECEELRQEHLQA